MTGQNVRQLLHDHNINLAWLSEQLGITPQGLNSRLTAQNFKRSYMLEINNVLKKDIFGLGGELDMQPILNLQPHTDASNFSNVQVIEYVSVPAFAGTHGVIYYGNDAVPKYENGDIIFITPQNDGLVFGQKYLFITKSGRYVRQVYSSNLGEDYLRLTPLNTSTDEAGQRLHPSHDIKKSEILFTFKIVGAISREQT